MPQEQFYSCKIQSLARCYYDCESWLDVLRMAEHDEVKCDPKTPTIYGVDNCDLSPFLVKSRSDAIYRLSRHDMIHNIMHAQWGRPKVLVTPATLIEYVHGALNAAGKLFDWMEEFERLCKTWNGSVTDFEERVWSHYEKIRKVLESGPGLPGMSRLRDLLADKEGGLTSLETILGSQGEVRRLLSLAQKANSSSVKLLASRRSGTFADFANLVDVCNCEVFLGLAKQIGQTHLVQLTTTGNLTLAACRLSVPSADPYNLPFRHLASPYIRTMIRQDEAAQPSRITKLRIGQLALEEFLHECEKVPAMKAITRADLSGLNPRQTVGVSKRLYDAMNTWLELIYFPYLRGLKPSETPSLKPKNKDVSFAMDWLQQKKEEAGDAKREKEIGRELANLVGIDSDEVAERLVPHHPEALRILDWLKQN